MQIPQTSVNPFYTLPKNGISQVNCSIISDMEKLDIKSFCLFLESNEIKKITWGDKICDFTKYESCPKALNNLVLSHYSWLNTIINSTNDNFVGEIALFLYYKFDEIPLLKEPNIILEFSLMTQNGQKYIVVNTVN
jgi:hypothetical protein